MKKLLRLRNTSGEYVIRTAILMAVDDVPPTIAECELMVLLYLNR